MIKNKTLLYIHNLSKTYHDQNGEVQALDHITFDVKEEEFLSIIGPSGCGKSTILSILSGMDSEYNGQITGKEDLTIGYMLQRDSLLEWKTILENCLLGLQVKGKITDENVAYVRNLLKKYGLEEFMDKYPSSLSGGMRQRVALIRTLAIKPDILLLDEP
ncbi:MAG: ATP-binding cassette domain-containing protein, partial [Bacilli bacterium]|nr:ATP-binding cassette domain-containing protein [Bacilli bacterium]